ncbi:MAG: M3 family oligoendopeptidase [bacterium]
MPYPTKWNLQRYFYKDINDPQIDIDFNKIEPLADSFIAQYKGKIASLNPTQFLEFFTKDDAISDLVNKVMLYFMYQSSLDTQNQEIIKKESGYQIKLVDIANKLLFVSQEFKDIGYDKLINLSKDPILKDYQNYFIQKADNIKYLLDEKTEFALNLKESSGSEAFNKLYEELTGSFKFKINLEGKEKEIGEEEVRSLRMDVDETTREKATKSITQVYTSKANQITLGNTYNALVKDWTSELKIRGFESVLSQRNISEQMPDTAVEILLKTVTENFSLYQRYLKSKKQLLISRGQQKDTSSDKIKSWNLYAPISKTEKSIEFNDALELFLKTIRGFDQEFYEFCKSMFDQERVDVFPKPGKRSGAFASYQKGTESFVLLNYTGKLHDVPTIAHELGHATHGHFSQAQKEQVFDSGLCLAETASIFNEILFADVLSKTLTTDEEKIDFLDKRLVDIFATIFIQIMYVNFEKDVHETIASGQDLTYEDFNRIWRSKQKELFGDLVEFEGDEQTAVGWSSIPHIFRTPFYCYSYAFGNILTFALYERYLQEGQKFVADYKAILKSGGSLSPQELLKQHGFDINSSSFYESGLEFVKTMVEDYENLISKI